MQDIEPKQLYKMLKDNKVQLFDVREKYEFILGHIENSINKPLSEIALDDFIQIDKDRVTVFTCLHGPRCLIAYDKLNSMGLKLEIYNLKGGVAAWHNEGLPLIGEK